MKEMLHFFGYAQLPQDPDNATGFFEYEGLDEELNQTYKGWQRQNSDMVDWTCQLTDADLTHFQYCMNDPDKQIPFYESLGKANGPLSHYLDH